MRRGSAGAIGLDLRDCHLGPLANGEGKVETHIRDLDQAAIGNFAHDLIRLGLSLATAAGGSDTHELLETIKRAGA